MVFRIGKVVNHLDQCTLVVSGAFVTKLYGRDVDRSSGDHQCGKSAERHGRMLSPCETGDAAVRMPEAGLDLAKFVMPDGGRQEPEVLASRWLALRRHKDRWLQRSSH